jgi:predicted dehydrogenase
MRPGGSSPSSWSVSITSRVGVVGCGGIACNVHLRVLRRLAGVEVVALADPDAGARARAQRLAPGAAAFATVPELLAEGGLDAVVVASPTPLHAEHARQVLAAGRHLYLEKPIATTVEDGRDVVAAGAEAGVVAAVGFNRRRHPLFVRAHALLRAGELGHVEVAQGSFCEPMPASDWRRSPEAGGPLLDLASHHVDALRWLLADEPTSVERRDDGTTAALTLGFAGGTVAQLAASFDAGRTDTLVLHGERGSLALDRYARSLRLTRATRGYAVRRVRSRPAATQLRWRARSVLQRGHDPSYAATVAAWVAAIQGDEQAQLPTLEDGLRSLEAVAAPSGTRVAL